MLETLGHEPSAIGVARLYAGLADTFVLDVADAALAPAVEDLGLRPVVSETLMVDPGRRVGDRAAGAGGVGVRIGIVGGSGDFGQGVAGRLRAHGHDVVIGSRTPRDDFVSNAECCERSDVVFLSIPAESVRPIARELSRHLAAKVVVSVATSVVFRDGHPTPIPAGRRSPSSPNARRPTPGSSPLCTR